MKPLSGQTAVVAGATRGAGRSIARRLAEAGAYVYCTGRSVRGGLSDIGRRETIEETAELIREAGGEAAAVRTDHTVEEEVAALFRRVSEERGGRLDILVNDIWGCESLTDWSVPFWKHSLANGLRIQERAVHTHLITAWHAAPLLIAGGRGLIVEITDGTHYRYRGNLFYSLAKVANIHAAAGMAEDLRREGVAAVAVTPGFLRSEEVLDYFGVTEANWRDAGAQDPHFLQSESPAYVARGIAALAADPNLPSLSGRAFGSWELAEMYGLTDEDGSRPNFHRYAVQQGLWPA